MSAPLLLAALLSTAHAVEDTWIRPAGTDCDENGGQPIVGTAGFANARDALNTNIQTYSATAFADRALFRTHRHGDNAGSAAMEMNITWGATTVPTYNTRAIDHAVNTDNCTPDYLVAMRPIDLSATNIGFAYQWERFGLFYSASVAYGGVAYPHNYLRGMMYGLGLPMYSVYALAAAPLLRTGYQTQTGASAFALDWIGGATYHDEHLGVRVGYAGSAGLYGSVNEQNSGLYLSSVVRGQGALLSQLETGLDRLPGHKVAKGLGLTSVFLRDLPYGATAPTEDATRSLLPESGSLRTVHLEQDNLFPSSTCTPPRPSSPSPSSTSPSSACTPRATTRAAMPRRPAARSSPASCGPASCASPPRPPSASKKASSSPSAPKASSSSRAAPTAAPMCSTECSTTTPSSSRCTPTRRTSSRTATR